MDYRSTRGSENKKSAAQAIIKGIAEDKGLYVPAEIPSLGVKPEQLKGMDYRQIAFTVLSRFLTDYTEEELR